VQASKKLMQELPHRNIGESRSQWERTSERAHGSCRGSGDGMQTQGTDATRETPAVIAVWVNRHLVCVAANRDDRLSARKHGN